MCRAQLPNSVKESIKQIRKWATKGKAWAQTMMGGRYEEGDGVRAVRRERRRVRRVDGVVVDVEAVVEAPVGFVELPVRSVDRETLALHAPALPVEVVDVDAAGIDKLQSVLSNSLFFTYAGSAATARGNICSRSASSYS